MGSSGVDSRFQFSFRLLWFDEPTSYYGTHLAISCESSLTFDIASSSRLIISASCFGVFLSSKMTTIAIETSPATIKTMGKKVCIIRLQAKSVR
jgi:hypothetical protein